MPANGKGWKGLKSLVDRIESYRTTADSASAILGQRLLNGESVTGQDAQDLGRTKSLISVLVQDMKLAGYQIAGTQLPRREGYQGPPELSYQVIGQRDVTAEIEADEAAYATFVARRNRLRKDDHRKQMERDAERSAARQERQGANGLPDARDLPREPRMGRRGAAQHLPVHQPSLLDQIVPHPALGGSLMVKVLALTDDAGLVMHLSNGNAIWQVQVIGHVSAGE